MRIKALAKDWLSDPRKLLLPAVALLAFIPTLDVLNDPDLWWHLRLGQWIIANRTIPNVELFSFTANGNPLVAHEWFTDVLFAAILSVAGLFAVAMFAALASWSALIVTSWRTCWRGVHPITLAVALLLSAKTAQSVLGTRPQVFTFLFVAITLLMVDRHLLLQRPGLKWLIPVFLLWANMHAGVVSGVGILGLVLTIEATRYRLHRPGAVDWRSLRGLGLVTAACALVAMINPDGPGIYWFAVHVPLTESLKPIVEWQSPNFHDPANYGLLLTIVTLVVLLPWARAKLSARDVVLAAAGLTLALSSVRNLAVGVALITPVWAIAFDPIVQRVTKKFPKLSKTSVKKSVKFGTAVGATLMVALAAVVGQYVVGAYSQAGNPSQGGAHHYPSCKVIAALNSYPQTVHLVAPYFDAGYLIYKSWPHVRVYEYGESISLGANTFSNYLAIENGQIASQNALSLLDNSQTNVVLVASPSNLDSELSDSNSGWIPALSDNGNDLYFRSPVTWTIPTC